tara:strand:+ start:927 stop:2195 length:1269 start_codon:yes stop_codon:yes gene_type:complete
MSGGKGGSTSSSVSIPEYIEDAARRNLTQADKIRKLGYVPEYGPTIAALTPMQEAASQNIADTASAFGTAGGNMSQRDIMGGMPEATTYAGGVRGYSAAPLYEQSLQTLAEERPGQKDYIDSFFIDQFTGAPGSNVQAPIDYTETRTPGDLGGITVGGGDLVSYPIDSGAGGGNGSALSDAEIRDYSQVIADELGMDSFDPSRTAESQMTPEQYAAYQSQSMSNPAQLAADNIYMNNLAMSGQGSLATGGMTGTTFGGNVAAGLNAVSNLPGFTGLLANEAAEAMAPRNEYRNTDNSNRTVMETQLDYQAAQRAAGLASGAIPAFDPNDPSTWRTPSGQNSQQASGNTYTNTYSGGYESKPAHATDNDREFDAFYDTKVQDPLSGKMLTPFQLNNRLQPGSLGSQYADMGITSLNQILNNSN